MKKVSKKITTAIIAATMLMSTACGSSEIQEATDTVVSETSVEATTEATVEAEDSAEEASTEEADAATESSSEDAADAASTEEETETEARNYERGTVDGNKYTNDSLGIVVEVPSTWYFLTDDELSEITGYQMDTIDNDTLTSLLEEATDLMDMYVVSDNGMDNLNLSVQKKTLLTKALDAQGYVDAALATTKVTLEAAGFEDVEIEESTVATANGELPCLNLKSMYSGYEVYQVVAVYDTGDYFVTFTSTVYAEDTAAEALQYVTINE